LTLEANQLTADFPNPAPKTANISPVFLRCREPRVHNDRGVRVEIGASAPPGADFSSLLLIERAHRVAGRFSAPIVVEK